MTSPISNQNQGVAASLYQGASEEDQGALEKSQPNAFNSLEKLTLIENGSSHLNERSWRKISIGEKNENTKLATEYVDDIVNKAAQGTSQSPVAAQAKEKLNGYLKENRSSFDVGSLEVVTTKK